MEIQEFKELLLSCLEDSEIIRKIESIQNDKNIPQRVSDSELAKYISQINDLNVKNAVLIEEIKSFRIKESNMNKISNELQKYQSLFGSLYNILELYNRLSEKNKEALKGIFNHNDPAEFIASGVQQGNIESLWEYAKILIMKRQYQDIDSISKIIYYFIHLYNRTKKPMTYELLKTKPGDLFDVEIHIRTSTSKPAGKIQKIILQGFKNINTDIIIKKSVVEL